MTSDGLRGAPTANDGSAEAAGGLRGAALAMSKSAAVASKLALKLRPTVSLFRPKDLCGQRITARLGLGAVPATAIAIGGHVAGGAVLFKAFEVSKPRLAALDAQKRLPEDLLPGMAAGAAHAVFTSPLVALQRTGTLQLAHLFEGLRPPVLARDSASFGAFFAVYGALKRDAATIDIPRATMAGAAAGLACHAVRFPLQTMYKRGRGWLDVSELTAGHLSARFGRTALPAIVAAGAAFGCWEYARSLAEAYLLADEREAAAL